VREKSLVRGGGDIVADAFDTPKSVLGFAMTSPDAAASSLVSAAKLELLLSARTTRARAMRSNARHATACA
jgi:hypothetical protein